MDRKLSLCIFHSVSPWGSMRTTRALGCQLHVFTHISNKKMKIRCGGRCQECLLPTTTTTTISTTTTICDNDFTQHIPLHIPRRSPNKPKPIPDYLPE